MFCHHVGVQDINKFMLTVLQIVVAFYQNQYLMIYKSNFIWVLVVDFFLLKELKLHLHVKQLT